jgi:RHS repeat-associated protein
MKTSITTQSNVHACTCKATTEKYVKGALLVAAFMLLGAQFAYGQRDGIGSFAATDAHDFDVVNLSNLVPSFNIPLISKSAGPLPVSLAIESNQFCVVFQPPHNNGVGTYCGGGAGQLISGFYFIPHPLWGIRANVSSSTSGSCTYYGVNSLVGSDNLSSWPISAPTLAFPPTCGTTSATVTTTDNTGITATLTAGCCGVTVDAAHLSSGVGFPGTYFINDPFGNGFSDTGTGPYTLTDALGAATTLPEIPEPGYYGYTDTTGHPQTISLVNGTPTTYQPIGNCGTLNVGTQVTPVSSISFPDGTSFGFTWDTNNGGIDGLIKSLTLRTGGTVTFTYGTVYSCSGGWAYNTLSRTTPDGTTAYSLSYSNGITTTTVLDPGKNKIVYTFFGAPNGQNSGSNPTMTQSVTRYQNTGTVASPVYTLISSTKYCYNNASCTTAASFPIKQLDTYEYAGTGSTQMSHRVETYDGYGNTLTDSNTDSITGQVKLVTYVYGTYSGTYPNGSCGALGNTNIHDHVCTKTTTVGGTQVAQKIYAYNSNGALTSSIDWLSSTSRLTTNYIPNANGTIASVTDPNLQVTTNGYAATGSGGCNGLLQTSSSTTVNGVVISSSKTWDCNDGVVLTTTDPNGNGTVAQYDSMFRPTMTQDQLGNQTTYSYTSNSTSSTDPMNVYRIRFVDNVGRPSISQTKQSPSSSNYDTVSTTYGWNGTNFQTQTGVPCFQTLDQPCPTVALTALTNPAVGSVSSSDANGGTTTNAYNTNDISVTTGPAPSGEHVKTTQTEVDGFSRTKSVCSVETSGGSACGQVMGNSGILTTSSYSFGTGSSTVTTTRGVQTHTTVLDAIGRQTSVQTPESGAVSYVYDSYPSGVCVAARPPNGVTSEPGDLMLKTLNSGQECFVYDTLHRVTDEQTSSANECRRMRYDATANGVQSTPSGYPSSGANIVGRMVEAETDNCSVYPPTSGSKITDEWFAYDKDGRTTDVWESTPNSGGYYHTTVVYDADGTVTSLNGIPTYTNAFTWGVDGEDRPNSFKLGTTTNISATAGNGFQYDAASHPLNVPIGTAGDQDTYTYDNVGHMHTYTFAVNGKSDAGTLTWNVNGSLGTLAITDTFNVGDSQTCNFSYDDVARLISDNCGTVWSQTYDYGVNGGEYDNLTQSGSASWNPGYNPNNNQMLNSTYDANGNLLYDGVNTFTWNLYGKMASASSGNNAAVCGSSGTCITYDANGQAVETVTGGTIRQLLYSPVGLTAQMNGQTPMFSHILTPGGGAVESAGSNGGGARIYLHSDWLGSARLSTLIGNRAASYDTAYGPYGEAYDKFGTVKPFDFTGDPQNIFGGLFDTPNRELAQYAGRWNSPDPAHASWNAYSYPTDPNRVVDPTGLDGLDCSGDCGPGGFDLGAGPWGSACSWDLSLCGDPETPPDPKTPPDRKIPPYTGPDFTDPSQSTLSNFTDQPDLAAMSSMGPKSRYEYLGNNLFTALGCAAQNKPGDPGCWGVKVKVSGGEFSWSFDLDAWMDALVAYIKAKQGETQSYATPLDPFRLISFKLAEPPPSRTARYPNQCPPGLSIPGSLVSAGVANLPGAQNAITMLTQTLQKACH